MFPPPFCEAVANPTQAGDLTDQQKQPAESQLRDSAGLAPASPGFQSAITWKPASPSGGKAPELVDIQLCRVLYAQIVSASRPR